MKRTSIGVLALVLALSLGCTTHEKAWTPTIVAPIPLVEPPALDTNWIATACRPIGEFTDENRISFMFESPVGEWIDGHRLDGRARIYVASHRIPFNFTNTCASVSIYGATSPLMAVMSYCSGLGKPCLDVYFDRNGDAVSNILSVAACGESITWGLSRTNATGRGTVLANLPETNDVARYERCNSDGQWELVPTAYGQTILVNLNGIGTFVPWGHTVPRGEIAEPIPTTIGFRIVTHARRTNTVWFSRGGELVSSPTELLVVPQPNRANIGNVLERFFQYDDMRLTSQPLPCQYRIGSGRDGGTLSGVARLFYGDARKWHPLFEANRNILKDANSIRDGQVITIPRQDKASNPGGAK